MSCFSFTHDKLQSNLDLIGLLLNLLLKKDTIYPILIDNIKEANILSKVYFVPSKLKDRKRIYGLSSEAATINVIITLSLILFFKYLINGIIVHAQRGRIDPNKNADNAVLGYSCLYFKKYLDAITAKNIPTKTIIVNSKKYSKSKKPILLLINWYIIQLSLFAGDIFFIIL